MGSATIGRRTPWQHRAPQRPAVDSRLKVVFLTPGFFHGGAERWILSLCRWLRQDVLGVVVTSPGSIDPSMRADLRQMAPLLPCDAEHEAAIAQAMTEADVVISWGTGEMRSYLHGTRAKVVSVAHTSGMIQETAFINGARPYVHHWVGVAEICRRSYPPDLAPLMTVIHNGADIERTTPIKGRAATRKAWGIRDDQIAVGYVGRLSPEKRPEAVAEAVSLLSRRYVAVLVGGGRDEIGTKEKCERVAPGRCIYAGHQPHSIGDALSAIDVWVNASPSEGFCLSLLEAQLAHVPCVSTKTGIWPEVADVYGPLVHAVEIGCGAVELADAVCQAMGATAPAITQRAYQVARDRFTAPAMGNRWDEFLRTITN